MLMRLFISEHVSQISAVDIVAIVDVMLAFAKILSNFTSSFPHCSRHDYLHREVVKLKCIHYEHVVCSFPLISNCLTIGLYLFILKYIYIYGSILVLDMCPSCKVLVVARLFVLSGTQTKKHKANDCLPTRFNESYFPWYTIEKSIIFGEV